MTDDPRKIRLEDGDTLSVAAKLQLYTLGVARLRYEMDLPPDADAACLAGLVRRVAEGGLPEDAVRAEVDQALARIGSALDQPHRWDDFETYTIVLVEKFRDAADPSSLAQSLPIAHTPTSPAGSSTWWWSRPSSSSGRRTR